NAQMRRTHPRVERAGTPIGQGKFCDSESTRVRVPFAYFTQRELVVFCGNPAIRGVRVFARARGPEALRRRLSTVMPLFDACKSAGPLSCDISGGPASMRGGQTQRA